MINLYWDTVRAGMDMWQTGFKLGETMVASSSVVDKRMAILQAAAANPLTGDYREIGQIVPEKVEAFSKAGIKLSQGWWAAHRDIAAQMHHMGALMMRGGIPTLADMQTMSNRGSRAVARAATTAQQTLAPIHKAATANARRLNGRKKTKRG
ncbi:MAG: hypothetical protein JWO25_852 [Alphaproteobacteria bacterium]|nr:hypothetical protein [Alphaproteobacteria bacterium]MDB5721778.1 hypothetical protein [Alphaproteobacteria bacterium]